jgi:L-asparagine transporter-like permease
MQKKYGFLPFAAKVLKVVAWIFLVIGVIGSIFYGIATGSAANGLANGLASGLAGGIAGFFIAVIGIIFSFLAWVFLLTARELLYLLMDVEENTRNTAERITRESS